MSNFTKKIVAIATALSVFAMVAPASAATVEELQALIASLTAQLAGLTAQLNTIQGGTTTGGVTGCTITSFTRDLSQGMSGNDVKCLQVILNSDAATQIASAGAGSPGSETTYFGALTKAAVVKFQNKYASEVLTPAGLTAGTGYVGAKTRAKLNAMINVVVVPGGTSVSLAPTTPAAGTVAQGSTNVEFTKVNFSAGATGYTVNTIAVTRGGISVNADVSSLKLYDGATQIGSTQALNNATNKATFTNLNWSIPANTAKTLTIKATVGTGSGDSVVLGIASASDVTASVTLAGTFPISGNAKTIAGTASAVGTFTAAMATTPAVGNILSGSVEQQVATLRLTATTEGFNVNSVKLTNVGTAGNSDIFNIKLKYGATVLGTVANMTGNAVTFTGSPLISVAAGTTKNIDIYVDTASGVNTSRSVKMEVTQAADIVATGVNSGGQVVTAGSFPIQGQAQTFNQGSLTVSTDAATNPPAQSYVIGTANRPFLAIKLSAGSTEGVRLTQLTCTKAGTIAATDISNLSLYDGTTLLATAALSGSSVQFGANTVNTFDTTGLVDIAASSNKVLTLKGDISSGATAAATGTFTCGYTGVKADGLLSQMDLPSGITGTSTGNQMTVGEKGTLAIAKDSTSPAAQTVAEGGTTPMAVAAYSFAAGTGEDVLVSAVTIRLYKDGSTTTNSTISGDLTNVSIWDGSTQLGATVANPVNSAAFNTNLVVPAGTTKILTVKLTVPTNSSGPTSFHADCATSDITSTGVSSNASVYPTGGAVGSLLAVGSPDVTVAAASVPVAAYKVTNTSGVIMTTLLLTAGTAENINVTQIKVTFDDATALNSTSSANASFQNVKLFDGATQIGSTMPITDNASGADYVIFNGFNLPITAGQTKAISVLVDVTGSSGTYYSGVATSGDVVGAGAVSGTSVSSDDNDKYGAGLTLTTGGNLIVSVDANTPLAANVAVGVTQGAQGVSFTKIKLAGTYENVKISALTLTRTGGRDSDFGAVYLYNGTTLVGTAYLSSNAVTFNFTPGNEIIVPAAGNIVLTVKADLMGIGAGSTHADAPKFYITTVATDITAKGVSSQGDITPATTTPNIEAAASVAAMSIYKTTASIALVGPTGGSSVSAAAQEVLRVNVTNNGAFDLTVTSFDVTSYYTGTSSATASTSLYWSTDLGTAIATGATVSSSGGEIAISPTSNNTVPAGTTKTLVLKADTTGTITSGTRSFHMDLPTVADFGWTPDGTTSEVITLTPGMPITGPTFTY